MQTRKKAVTALLCAVLLCGCAGRELEDRTFAEAMELDLRDGELWGGFGGPLVKGASVEEIQKTSQEHMDTCLELGHVKAIVLGKSLTEDAAWMQKVLLELEQMPVISRNSLVFRHDYEREESYLESLKKQGKTPGEYLLDRYENNPYRAEEEMTSLGDLLNF